MNAISTATTKQTETPTLFEVTTIVRKYGGYKDVEFCWYYNERTPRFCAVYATLIEGYEPSEDMRYAEDALEECFTAEEAEALKVYLDAVHGDVGTTTISQAKLPIAKNVMPCGAMPAGGEADHHMLSEEPEYSLPFKVWGYFDTRHCETLPAGRRHH